MPFQGWILRNTVVWVKHASFGVWFLLLQFQIARRDYVAVLRARLKVEAHTLLNVSVMHCWPVVKQFNVYGQLLHSVLITRVLS